MRKWGVVVAVLGLLLLTGAALLRYVVVPNGQVLPADTDEKIVYEGTLTAMDSAAIESGDAENAMSSVPVRVDRRVQVLEAEGDKARVSDAAVVTNTETGEVVSDTEYFYTVDRQTLMAVPNFTDKPAEKAEGLVIGFPIGTEKYNYVGWLQEVEDTGHSLYKAEAEVKGLDVYRFTGDYAAPLDEDKLPPGSSATVPKADLVDMVKAMGLSPDLQQQLDDALPVLPDEIPLVYTYGESDVFLVEPSTGVIADMTRKTSISVGMAGIADVQFPVYELAVGYTPANVTDMVDKAQDGLDQLELYGTTIPVVLASLGVVFLVVSIPMVLHRRKKEEPAPPTPPRQVAMTK